MIVLKNLIGIIVLYLLFLKNYVLCHSTPFQNVIGNKSSNTLLEFLNLAENVIKSAKRYAIIKTKMNTEYQTFHPIDCAAIHEYNISSQSGVYIIWPPSRVINYPISVYCDMEDDGGAWTVIQRRGNFDSPDDYFYRDKPIVTSSYQKGFGNLKKDFWIGNDKIFTLTNIRANSLKFDLVDWEGNVTYATYDSFWIDDEIHNYEAHVTGYRGTAGDSFSFVNGHAFTTKDRDNDKYGNNCAVTFKGAWWYAACHGSNLNGLYLKGAHESYADGVEWSSFRGQHYSLKSTVMKIRPKDFKKNNSDMTPQ